ncbi:MAG: LysR substrate-binding domain-containing protein [Armatimonas sp.]
MNSLELHQLRCLVVLAEELNFGRAATRLHMSQPPLTRLVADVERLVGARLFERTTRRVQLTNVGEVFISEARAVLARADSALETVRSAVRKQTGQLRLAYTPLALQTILPELLSALREQEHDISIDLIEQSNLELYEALQRGHIDLCFTNDPLEQTGFQSYLVHREALQVMLPESHPLARKTYLAFGELAQETFILHPPQEYPAYYARVLAACQEAGFMPRVQHRDAQQNCLALVAAGQGVLLSPAYPHFHSSPGFRRVPLAPVPKGLHSDVWAVIPEATGSPYLEKLRRLIQVQAG